MTEMHLYQYVFAYGDKGSLKKSKTNSIGQKKRGWEQ